MSDRAYFDYLLRLGDDSLVLGQRLGEWCGHAPTLEIDLSLANVSLDLIGQATYLLGHAGTMEGEGRDADRLAFHRDALDFRNCLLVEQPNGDFAQTIARQFLFSTYQRLLFDKLAASPDAQLAAIAAKAVKEVAYHADLAAGWVVRLGDGTQESRQRMVEGLEWMARFVDELFAMDAIETGLSARGLAVDKAALRLAFDAIIARTLAKATLPPLPSHRPVLGGRKGHHSEHLGHLLAPMQYLQRTYPNASW
ncbi:MULTISPECIES: 1,2-phenylacetyl-CoA epoxidase subunit PaaC [Niveispirillum]|uniref:Phenylacetate-CoA oxygenase subunit PaaI n=2 Tax=Niveispirillum TaxID=1543704 RepID=A0A255Z6K3_9PROT|nr:MULTISPECIES: 1,2-phenylacetyl-CoA epoxidase subunit PaaC [Niveispirillum]AUN31017.1 phenylacetate-CoA oxygenase subunit PaaI [Niveispirillum cyanobacteriorum]OYQ37062.1 phenylacetate-CoA oxygenase subunit PaaI [Niveispirillum lacus]GGE87883.1 phenylacetic acid degradation protein [Niveispirillum cyanobacteriorum]